MRFYIIALLLLFCCCASAQADWEARAEAKAHQLIQKNGPGTDAALKQGLLKMYAEDQSIRNRLDAAPAEQRAELDKQMEEIDARLTTRLKQIVAAKGWPTIALVGSEASQAAAVMLIHSPDHGWQAARLPHLQKLVREDKIFGSDVATLTDRILVSQGKPQEFGTQYKDEGDKLLIMPIADPKRVDKRRARYMLPPMAAYKKMLSDIHHMPIE
jgi:hypothetical protein